MSNLFGPTYKSNVKRNLRPGFLFYLLFTGVLTVQFMFYLFHSQILGMMDFWGWTFYIASCISHSACIALIPFLIYIVLTFMGCKRLAITVFVLLATFTSVMVYINEQVYNLYRFHINGLVLNMAFGKGGNEIFQFDWRLYLKYFIYIALTLGAYGWAMFICQRKNNKMRPRRVWTGIGILIFFTLFAHLSHIFGSFYERTSVVNSGHLLPYYFPTTAYGALSDLGLEAPKHQGMELSTGETNLVYPVNELQVEKPDSLTNILFILIDSWNCRALDKETMPQLYSYAEDNQWYTNHYSGSNGTRSALFGFFFGLPSYYWQIMESNHVVPLILDVARDEGYTFRVYPSAQIYNPAFNRVLFAKEKNLRIETKGETVMERDEKIAQDFISAIKSEQNRKEPFFSFLFFDLPHGYSVPKQYLRFKPTWEYAKFDELNNDTDPLPFWNMYRSTCYVTDSIVGTVINAIKETGLDKNTAIIITGDHAQEFNENKKNFWGHNGNFSRHQSMVPLICHFPNEKAGKFKHRTTHYDIVPTVMSRYMGVKNPTEDYSSGHDLQDKQSRDWHIVGSELNYAFIVEGDTIIEKTAEGGVIITDNKLNPAPGYHIDQKKFTEAIKKLNHFLK